MYITICTSTLFSYCVQFCHLFLIIDYFLLINTVTVIVRAWLGAYFFLRYHLCKIYVPWYENDSGALKYMYLHFYFPRVYYNSIWMTAAEYVLCWYINWKVCYRDIFPILWCMGAWQRIFQSGNGSSFITMTSLWAWWYLKSPASRLITQPFIQTQIKENIKAPRHWPLCGEFTGPRWIPRTNGQLCGKSFHFMTSSWPV